MLGGRLLCERSRSYQEHSAFGDVFGPACYLVALRCCRLRPRRVAGLPCAEDGMLQPDEATAEEIGHFACAC
jgi:hypothetical protein